MTNEIPPCLDVTLKNLMATKEISNMPNTYTAVTKKDGDWWIGWIEEVSDFNCQERTREELLQSREITFQESIVLSVGGEPRGAELV